VTAHSPACHNRQASSVQASSIAAHLPDALPREVGFMASNPAAEGLIVRELRRFGEENARTSWLLFLQNVVLFAAVHAAMALLGPWSYWIGTPLLALLSVRLFIFFHDYLHGAIFKGSKSGAVVMDLFGFYFLTVPSVWRAAHNQHHLINGRLSPWFMGGFPVLSTEEWATLQAKQRLRYKLYRHPLNILFCHFTLFLIGQCVAMPIANLKAHWRGLVAVTLYVGGMIGISLQWGFLTALAHLAGPLFIGHAIGGLLFYMQHNAPGLTYVHAPEWNSISSALRATTWFQMSPLLQWFTGNIGFHNVHHINHFIPFYRLPEAMAVLSQHTEVPVVRWGDTPECLSGAIYSFRAGKMVSYAEAEAELREPSPVAA
jgi:acyl-lipid omega-6 desaturase (Delta-12 desaturase)